MEFIVNFPVTGVNAAVMDYFIVFFCDIAYESFYKFHNRNRFQHKDIIFVLVVVESDRVTIISIDPGGGNDGPAKIASNVFYNYFGIVMVWHRHRTLVYVLSSRGIFHF